MRRILPLQTLVRIAAKISDRLAALPFPPSQLGFALYSEMFANPRRPVNSSRFAFLDPRAITFFVDWERVADDSVAILRGEAGRNPHDRDLSDLIGELSTQSEDFRVRWAKHNVRYHDTGVKRLHHPIVGELELTYEALILRAESELTMFAYTAEPGSRSAESLDLLANWTAPERVEATNAREHDDVCGRPGSTA
ncbi:MAG: hypothetical protein WAU41_08685 [Gaiellaceae bacterium]